MSFHIYNILIIAPPWLVAEQLVLGDDSTMQGGTNTSHEGMPV
jgi:hypothetical protein